jgi:hypothetical protein
MTISWKIPIERLGSDDDQLLELAHDLMPLFVMDPEEYRVRNGSIEGTPDALRFTRLVTPIRVAVYDVMVIPQWQQREVTLRFRLYKGIALAILVWLFNGLIVGSIWKWESMLLPAFGLVVFNGLAFMTILSSRREATDIVQRWGRTQG